jgi:hypothetical protein
MADFSLTTLFVVPVGQTALPSSGSTQNLTAGQFGIFKSDYTLATAANIAASPYFYVQTLICKALSVQIKLKAVLQDLVVTAM